MNQKLFALSVSLGMVISLSAHAVGPPGPVTALTNHQVFSGVSPIYFTWINGAGATGTLVERSTDNKTWTKLAAQPSGLATTYSDGTAALNTSYYYRVTSTNELTRGTPVELAGGPFSHKMIEAQYNCNDSKYNPLWVVVYLNSSTSPPTYQGAYQYNFGVYQSQTGSALVRYQTYDSFPVTAAALAAVQAGKPLDFSGTGFATYDNTESVDYAYSAQVQNGLSSFSANTTSGPAEGFALSGLRCTYAQ